MHTISQIVMDMNQVEGWSFKDGYYYVVGNLCCLATPLTDVSPEDRTGKVPHTKLLPVDTWVFTVL